MKNLLIAGICLLVVILLPDLLLSVQEDTADTLYIDGFAIDKAFLQELKDVIDYDSTDFLTYELNYYNDILKNEPRLDELRSKKNRHLSEYDVYYNNEEFEEALTSYKLYLTYKDSINTILNARNVTDLNEQYNTVEKQNNIKILNRENRLKSLDLDKRKQLRWIMYIISVFLFLFLVFTLNFVRLKFIKKRKLDKEAIIRRKAENELWQAKSELEELVLQRKNELLAANQDLENEILEIEELHHKIFQAERLKIVGEMATGMLEVIENPVRTMDLEINSFRDDLETPDPEIEEMAETLQKASTKVKKTLAKLNQYSLADKTDLKLADLNEIVRNSVNLFKFRNREREIEFSLELSASIPLLLLDKVKIEGVLINLIMNAIDSFSGHGQIRIRTRNSGRNVVLTLTDNGCGIDKVKLKDIFSPFFTTKETGYGLGLSIVHRNISAMHGSISFTSTIGKGTKVKICFPAGDNDVEA